MEITGLIIFVAIGAWAGWRTVIFQKTQNSITDKELGLEKISSLAQVKRLFPDLFY